MEGFDAVSVTHNSHASTLYWSSLASLRSGLSGARCGYTAHRLVVYEHAAFQFPCFRLLCTFVHLLASARLGVHGIVWEFSGLYLVEQGVVAPPLCPFAATHIATLHARALIGLRLAQLPPRVIMEMGSGVRPLLLLEVRPRGANCVVPSPLMQQLAPPPHFVLDWACRYLCDFAEFCELAQDNLLLPVVCCFLLLVSD